MPTIGDLGGRLGLPTKPPGWTLPPTIPSPTTVSNPSGDDNRVQTRPPSGETGGLSATIFEDSKEFSVLPIRFGYLYKDTTQPIQSATWAPILGFTSEAEYGIVADSPGGVLTFPELPVGAWIQVYAWLQFANNPTGIRYGRIVNHATGDLIPAGREGQNANSADVTAFSWCTIPVQVGNLPLGVRLEAYQSAGSQLNVEMAALWAKRTY